MTYMFPPIRVIGPADFNAETAQTPGSNRLTAIAPGVCPGTAMWGGLFEMEPGERTGIHHHGEQQTIAYVLSGTCEMRWGAEGEYTAWATAGDFIHVPAFLPHMEINLSVSDSLRWVVVRSTPEPIVVSMPDDAWG